MSRDDRWKLAFFQAQANASVDGILVVDELGVKVFQNDRVGHLFSIPAEIALSDDDGPQRRWAADQTVDPAAFDLRVGYLMTHPSETSRDEVRLKNGTVLDCHSSPVLGPGDEYYGRLWTFRDITASTQAAASLQLLRAAVQQSRESIVITDATLDRPGPRIVFVNAAFTRMTGYTSEEALGQTPRILQGPRTDPQTLHRLRRALERGERFEGEAVNYRKNGEAFDMEWQVAPIQDAAGHVAHFVAIQRDVSERKRAGAEVERQQSELRALFDVMPAMIWFKDTRDNILRVNQRAANAAGMTVAEIEGRPAREIYPAEAARFHADDRQVIESGRARLGSVESLQNAAGETRWVRVDRVPYFDKDGAVIGLVAMSQDFTEHKQLETQLFQAQKLETVGRLAGGIAHEFNSILTAIMGQSQLLLDDLPAGSMLAIHAREIGAAAVRAATLTSQLLAYGRKQWLRPEPLDLNVVLAGMDGVLRQLMGPEVNTRLVHGASLRTVSADAGQIEQVIMNMAINARDAMPSGGKLTLETANVFFDPDTIGRYPDLAAGGYVMLAITDTGVGMSPVVRTNVFEPFFSTKGVGKGSGLGLSTCYGIVKQSQGHISVYSEPGRGTTFKVYLPSVEPLATTAELRPASSGLPHGTETVLLVEDDPALREMATILLGRLGYRVLAAANGLDALRLQQQPGIGFIDVLFTDVVMPHMAGTELAERVRGTSPHTRVLFTSAHTHHAFVHQGVLPADVALLQKPFTPRALAGKLREVLDMPSQSGH